jgi:hypothetical protein
MAGMSKRAFPYKNLPGFPPYHRQSAAGGFVFLSA